MDHIVGVLDIMSMIKYGLKNNVYLYMFKPTNKDLPIYYVPFNLKTKQNKMYKDKGKNIYALINFFKIENNKHIGHLYSIIGSIGDLNVEYDFLLYKHGLNYKTNKLCTKSEQILECTQNINNVVTIDPINCVDIDDAIHYSKKDGLESLGIHIADVSYYVLEGSELDIEARKRLTTIYGPNRRIDMLPEKLSTDICSLKEGFCKRVISINTIFDENMNILNVDIKRQIIKSNKAYNYEQVDELIKSNINENNIIDLYNLSIILLNKYNFNIGSLTSSHKMIEIFMIYANMTIANKLINMNTVNNPILRKHTNNSINKLENDYITDPMLKQHIINIGTNKGEYTCSKVDTFHSGLNVPYYTHFTSPIRRYADIVVHRLLFNEQINEQINDLFIESLNNVNTKCKKLNRDIAKLQLINLINTEIICTAYIVDIEDKFINIYIPEYSTSCYFRLFNKKMDNIIKCTHTENSVMLVNGNKQYTLTYLDKVTVKMVAYMEHEIFSKKLICRIIEMEHVLMI